MVGQNCEIMGAMLWPGDLPLGPSFFAGNGAVTSEAHPRDLSDGPA